MACGMDACDVYLSVRNDFGDTICSYDRRWCFEFSEMENGKSTIMIWRHADARV